MAKSKTPIFVGIAVIALIAILGILVWDKVGISSQSTVPSGTVLTPVEQAAAANSCGSTKQTTVALTLKNGLNTTAAQTVDTNYVLYEVMANGQENQIASGSDTTAGSQTLNCGTKYHLKLLSASGVNSRITSVYTGNAKVEDDGSITFTTTAATMTIGFVGSNHAAFVVKAYDEELRGDMYDAADSDKNVYEASGVSFTSTTDNATATAVTAGSSLRVTYSIKNSDTVADFNDFGTLVMFDATNTYWDKVQQVTFDGVQLNEVKSQLNADETKKFANYEFVYLIPAGKMIDGKTHSLSMDVLKSSGAVSTDNLSVDFAVRGNYLSVDGFSVKQAAAKDSSTNPMVYNLFETTIETQ